MNTFKVMVKFAKCIFHSYSRLGNRCIV
jgi:hypothetical protein